MSLFKRRKEHDTCRACLVHFEAHGPEKYAHYCSDCRKPLVEQDRKMEIVQRYAERHVDELLPKAEAEAQAIHEQNIKAMQSISNLGMDALRRQQMAGAQQCEASKQGIFGEIGKFI